MRAGVLRLGGCTVPARVKKTLGVGIIGLGSAGTRHARALLGGKIQGAHLAAVWDSSPERLTPYSAIARLSSEEMMGRGEAQAVVIATPHPTHEKLAIQALRARLPVLVEKPLALQKLECERLLMLHRSLSGAGTSFGVVHDYRADDRFRFVAELLAAGELGRVERVVWQATDWFRTDAYYLNSTWRGRFASEGGGLLVNQAPHLLDTLCWLFGLPCKVLGICRFGRFHDIEVEDDVTAYLHYASGVTAHLILGTGEAPGSNRFEVSGDRGRVVVEGRRIWVHRNREPASVYRRREAGGRPLSDVSCKEFDPSPTGLRILQNFVDATRSGEALVAPAAEAAQAVELANALLWSTILERPLELPIDAERFSEVYREFREGAARRLSG